MKIDCISDLHGAFPKLEGGDLLIIAGDLTARDEPYEYLKFLHWFDNQKYSKRILVCGNHDNLFQEFAPTWGAFDYLCDSTTEFEGLKIYGSPWTRNFRGQNENCKSFGLDIHSQMMEKWMRIPNDIDILVTHTPPYGILDKASEYNLGCSHLRSAVLNGERFKKLKLHVFGHIHEHGGQIFETSLTKFVNASIMNERYEPVNKPVRIEL